jgi:hypothetical protein
VEIVPIADAREAIAGAEAKVRGAAPPAGARLPIEPSRPFPADALKELVAKRAGSLKPYSMAALDFDVSFITPVMTFGAQYQADQAASRNRGSRTGRGAPLDQSRPLEDFENWRDYVGEFLPVVMIRVTPKLVEGFWQSVGRNAASTQGVMLPAMKHVKTGFAALRLTCGDAEVTPIHPFRIEHRVPGKDDAAETQSIYEGLYVFAPDAIGPQCGTVKLTLFSEKTPDKGDTRVVDAKIVDQVWRDFAAWRER